MGLKNKSDKMLSLFRPSNFFDSMMFPSVRMMNYHYTPQEGRPFVEESDSHWIVKVYLPDVAEEDFRTEIVDDQVELHWTDLKKIQHRGRVYESRESQHESIKIPKDVNHDEIESKFEKNFGIVRIPKPQAKHVEVQQRSGELIPQQDEDPNTLMRMKIPRGDDDNLDVQIQGDCLCVTYSCSGKRETGEGDNKHIVSYSNRVQKRTKIPEGIDSSQIDSRIENGELIISRKSLPAPIEQSETSLPDTAQVETSDTM